jgi:hypothetical protein
VLFGPDLDRDAAQRVDEELFLGGDVCRVHVMMAVDNRAILCGSELSGHVGRTSEQQPQAINETERRSFIVIALTLERRCSSPNR